MAAKENPKREPGVHLAFDQPPVMASKKTLAKAKQAKKTAQHQKQKQLQQQKAAYATGQSGHFRDAPQHSSPRSNKLTLHDRWTRARLEPKKGGGGGKTVWGDTNDTIHMAYQPVSAYTGRGDPNYPDDENDDDVKTQFGAAVDAAGNVHAAELY